VSPAVSRGPLPTREAGRGYKPFRKQKARRHRPTTTTATQAFSFSADTARPDITPVPFLAKTRQEKQTKNKKNKMHRDLSTSARKMKQKRTNNLKCTTADPDKSLAPVCLTRTN